MKRRILAIMMALVLCLNVFSACGSTKGEEAQSDSKTEVETTEETTTNEVDEEESGDDKLEDIEAIGDVEVDKGIFNVTLTIPQDFVGEMTQEKLDETVKEKGYKSATLNEDGSVTYVMTKAQHKEMMDGIKESIDQSLSEMVGSEDYPNITDITANDDYTSFTITTKNTEPDMAESFAAMAFYMYGGMYGIFAGQEVENVHIEYVNADTGEVISSSDSKDLGDSE